MSGYAGRGRRFSHEPDGVSMSIKRRRWPWLLGAIVLLAVLAYPAGGNFMLWSGVLAEIINKKPHKLKVEWAKAWTLWPGEIHIEGFSVDIHGRKRIFTYGTAIFTGAALLIGLSTSASMLIATRVVQGIGSAMIFGTGVAILTSAFPPHERGRVLGINVAAVYLGLSLGPSIGGFLTEELGWRSIFLVTNDPSACNREK